MIKSLTSLRGIFILFIFLHHCMNLYPGGGSMAVAFFFVLGGYSMTLGYYDRVLKTDFNYRQYLLRRYVKFYPLHWICMLLAVPLMVLLKEKFNFSIFLANASLLQTWIPLRDYYFSFNWVSWYLANTIYFAIVFPVVFKLIVKTSNFFKILITVFGVSIYIFILYFLPPEEYHTFLYISPYIRLTDFIFGIFLALLFIKFKESDYIRQVVFLKYNSISNSIIAVLIILLVIESCLLDKNIRLIAPLYWPMVALLILLSSMSDSGGGILSKSGMLQRLGKLSFTIFLIHQLIIRYTKLFFKFFQLDNTILFVVLTLFGTIFFSILVERYFVNPITQWLTKRFQPSTTAQ